MDTNNTILEAGDKPVENTAHPVVVAMKGVEPALMTNEEIVALIKRLAVALRDRTASEIAEIKRKKELIDTKKAEIKQRFDKENAKANGNYIAALDFIKKKIAEDPSLFTHFYRVDKSGFPQMRVSAVREVMGKPKETVETKRLSKMLNALTTASNIFSDKLKALGVGTVNVHSDHIYIRLPEPEGAGKEDDIAKIKAEFQKYLAQQAASQL